VANLLVKIVRRLYRKPQIKRLIVPCKSLDGALLTYQARIPLDIELLPSDVEEVEDCLAHIPPEHRFDVARRIQHGDRCCVARHAGQIVYVTWIAFGACYSYALDREYKLTQEDAYLYSAYTLPEFRGNGIHPAAHCHIARLLKDWGYRWLLCFIEPENTAAMRLPDKLGYEKIGVIGFVEVFGFRRYFHRDCRACSALRRQDGWRKM